MKKTAKVKIFMVALSFICVLSFMFCSKIGFVQAESVDSPEYSEEYLKNAELSTEIYSAIHNIFEKQDVTLFSFDSSDERAVANSYVDDFTGVYIDADGELNIGVLQEQSPLANLVYQNVRALESNGITNRSLNGQEDLTQKVNMVQQQFSYNDLKNIQNYFTDEKILDYNIISIGINQELNCLDIYVSNLNKKTLISDYLSEQSVSEESYRILVESKIKPTASEANSGTPIWYTKNLFWKVNGTIGFNAIDNSTGKKGIVTNAHVADSGKKMKHKNGTVGTRSKGWHSGTIDAAFVPFDNQSNWQTSFVTYYNDYNYMIDMVTQGEESQIIQGAPIAKVGDTTKKTTGTIQYTDFNCSLTYDGESSETIIKNCIKYSNQSLGGDSGGPVYMNQSTRRSYYLLAINFAGPKDPNTSAFGIGCRLSNILSELNLTMVKM